MDENTSLRNSFHSYDPIAPPPASISFAQGQACTTLSAYVNALAIYLTKYELEIRRKQVL
ncbi:MAG: hypothetical protein QXV30_00025 [Desulfurococcaceae archaeon]